MRKKRTQLKQDLNIPLTNEEYVEEAGEVCPYCKMENCLESTGSPEISGVYCWLNVECTECHKQWIEEYKLSGYGEKMT